MGVTRHQKENNLRIGSLKFKLQRCRKSEVLLSFFDGNIVRDIVYTCIVSLTCHYGLSAGPKLAPLDFLRELMWV